MGSCCGICRTCSLLSLLLLRSICPASKGKFLSDRSAEEKDNKERSQIKPTSKHLVSQRSEGGILQRSDSFELVSKNNNVQAKKGSWKEDVRPLFLLRENCSALRIIITLVALISTIRNHEFNTRITFVRMSRRLNWPASHETRSA